MTFQGRSEVRSLAALAAILTVSTAVRAYLFNGFTGLDDAEYARFAYQMAHGRFEAGDYTGPAVFPLRIGLIAPTAALVRWLGLTEWATVLYPFVLSLAGITLIYLCASRLFGPNAGLIAAGLLGLFPWDIDSATRLVPDLPAATYAAAGATLIMIVEQRAVQRRGRLFVIGALAGLGFGLSWLCKESVAYLAPFCAVWMVMSIRRRGSQMVTLWGGVAAGSLAVVLGEMVTYLIVADDFWFRLHEVERNYRQWENSFFTEGSAFGWERGGDYGRALRRRLFVSGPAMILFNPSFLYLPLLGLAVTVYAWLRRDRSFLVPGIWLWTLVLMFNFASSSTTSYVPLALFNRYLYPLFFPAIVLVSGFLAQTVFARQEAPAWTAGGAVRWGGILTALFLAAVGGTELVPRLRNPSAWLSEVKPLLAWVTPDARVFADALSLRAFEFFHRYPTTAAWTELGTVDDAEQIPPGSLVLINQHHIEWLDRNAGMWVSWPAPGPTDPAGYPQRPFYTRPPPHWTRLRHDQRASLYRVDPPADREIPTDGGLL